MTNKVEVVLAIVYIPSSTIAVRAGCTCPVTSNNSGRGVTVNAENETEYWLRLNCPLHGNMARIALAEMRKKAKTP